jgi:hypothetical protein
MGKSPFVKKETYTYRYPDPFDLKAEDAEAERLAALGAVDPDIIRRIDPEEIQENHWVTFRIPRSAADVDAIGDATQSMTVMGDRGLSDAKFEQRISYGNQKVFELLCEEWSFDAEPNSASYAMLNTWAADWIRACMADALSKGTSRDYVKKTKVSSTTPEPSEETPSRRQRRESASE